MANLFNQETGQWEEVPDAELDARYRTGRYALPELPRYTIRNPDSGEFITVERGELNTSLQSGWRLAGPEEVRAAQLEREQGGAAGMARTFAEGAQSMTSFGLSDQASTMEGPGSSLARLATSVLPLSVLTGAADAAERLGGASDGQQAEEYRARADLNPGSRVAGEVAAVVVPSLFTGGAPAVVSAPGLAARAGLAAERLAAGAFTRGLGGAARSTAGRLAVRGAGRLAGGAVEGAGFGAGQYVSESALEDREMTAEGLLASMGMGSVLGGAGNVGLGAAGDVAGIGVRALGRGAQRFGRSTREALSSLYERQTGQQLAPGVAELFGRVSGTVTGRPDLAPTITRLTGLTAEGRRARGIISRGDDVLEDATRSLRAAADSAETDARSVMNAALGEGKASRMGELARGMDAERAVGDAAEMLARFRSQVDEMLAEPATFGFTASARRIRQRLDEAEQHILEAWEQGGDDVAGRIFTELDQVKRLVGQHSRPGVMVTGSADASGLARIRGLYDDARRHLERTDLYGRAAEAQRSVNQRWTQWLGKRDLFRQRFLTQVGTDEFNPVFTVDPAKLDGYLGGLGRARGDLSDEVLTEQVRAQRELVDEIGRWYELPPELQGALRSARENTRAFEKTLGRVRDEVGVLNQFRELQQAGQQSSSLVAGGIGAGIGGTIAGGPGAAVGATALGMLARPDQVVRTIAQIERVTQAIDGRMQGSAKKFVRQALGRAREAAGAVGRTARRAAAPATLEAFQEQVQRAAEWASNPSVAAERTGRATRDVHQHAPNVAAAMATQTQRAAAFLHARTPEGALRTDTLQPHLARPRVSDAEVSRFMRYVQAVDRPLDVLEDLERGRITREQVETLREVYPRLYERLQRHVMTELASAREPLPYPARLQLGILLDIPTDPSLRPETIAMLQARYAAPVPEPQTPAPTATGPSPELVASHASETDRLVARRAGAA